MDFEKSKTRNNLIAAFAGESQARNRYTYYAEIAGREGFKLIEEIFLETADNEKIHAKLYFDHLVKRSNDSMVKVEADYPVALADTAFNLQAAAQGEHDEWSDIYPSMAKVAKEEGFDDIARTYERISQVEERHEERYLKLLKEVKEGTFFKKPGKVKWKCRICGHIIESSEVPPKCPVCKYGGENFELFVENY